MYNLRARLSHFLTETGLLGWCACDIQLSPGFKTIRP
jgi:hypothetical protein